MKRIIIYGYGKAYQRVKEQLDGCEIVAFADQRSDELSLQWKNKSEGNSLFIHPSNIITYEYDYVAISSPGYYEQIKQQLVAENGVKENKIISLQMFVKDKEDDSDIDEQSLKEILEQKGCTDSTIQKYIVCPEKEPQGMRFSTSRAVFYVEGWKRFTLPNTKIYSVMHKEYGTFSDELYTPLTVGDFKKDGFLWEGQGENISYLNKKINECTALYWIWKNSDADIVGLNHYHRYFYNNGFKCRENRLDGDIIRRIMSDYDMIVYQAEVPRTETVGEELRGDLPKQIYDYGYDLIYEELKKNQPEYEADFRAVWKEKKCCYCNMFVSSKKIADAYCEWLFSFLIPVAEKADVSHYNLHDSRVIGFFAERMLSVWLHHNPIKVRALPVFVPC